MSKSGGNLGDVLHGEADHIALVDLSIEDARLYTFSELNEHINALTDSLTVTEQTLRSARQQFS